MPGRPRRQAPTATVPRAAAPAPASGGSRPNPCHHVLHHRIDRPGLAKLGRRAVAVHGWNRSGLVERAADLVRLPSRQADRLAASNPQHPDAEPLRPAEIAEPEERLQERLLSCVGRCVVVPQDAPRPSPTPRSCRATRAANASRSPRSTARTMSASAFMGIPSPLFSVVPA